MLKGKIIIISGPSGAGKTTLYKKLLRSKKFKNEIVKSISMTTRPRRRGERAGRDYFFISEPMFLYKRKAGHFLESQKVFNHYYGTPKKNVEDLLRSGKNVLLCIDVRGAKEVSGKCPNVLKVFIKTSSLELLETRLRSRGTENNQDMGTRLSVANAELTEAKNYDFVVVNDHLNKAYRDLDNFLSSQILDKRG